MKNTYFGSDFHYPDKSNPQFRVSSITDGYYILNFLIVLI